MPHPIRYLRRRSLEARQRRAWERKKRETRDRFNKVFGIGGPKTGTSSLGRALVLLGYQHHGWDEELHDRFLAGDVDAVLKAAAAGHTFEDGPWNMGDLYQRLDKEFPGSRFILTVRETEAWSRSHESHFSARGSRKTNPRVWKEDYDREAEVRAYLARNQEIVEYFRHRPDDLLVVDICAGEGWEALCPFLGEAIPDVPFPHENPRK